MQQQQQQLRLPQLQGPIASAQVPTLAPSLNLLSPSRPLGRHCCDRGMASSLRCWSGSRRRHRSPHKDTLPTL